MKILSFVDLHGSNAALKRIKSNANKENIDIVICAGDITIFGDSIKQMVQKIDKIGKPILMLHGNHESKDRLADLCKKSKNILFMHKQVQEIDGFVFIGYGGGGFENIDPEFDVWAKELIKQYEGNKKIIFFTHGPPYNTKLDLILDQSAGNKSYNYLIEKLKPKLYICGHLHENAGIKQKIGRTLIINPGPWGHIMTV